MSSPEQRLEWVRVAGELRQRAGGGAGAVAAAGVGELADAVSALVAEVDWLRGQLRQRSGAIERLRAQRGQLALRVSGHSGEDWEDVLASVGVERQAPRVARSSDE